MEVSVIVGGSQVKTPVNEVFPVTNMAVRVGIKGRRFQRVSFLRKAQVGFVLVAGRRFRRVYRSAVRSEMPGDTVERKAARSQMSVVSHRPQLYVGLPLDAVSDCNAVNHAKAIAAGLKALKLLGVDGVEMPVWWGVVEKEVMGKYNWSGYLALVQMVQDAGLKIRTSLYFHASKVPGIPLPSWVSNIGDANPDIYFADREGRRHKDCLSFSVDDLPLLDGKSALQVYEEFCKSFQASFKDFIGSTITDIAIGMGQGGELKYPSLLPAKNKQGGAGQFQCYDKYMLNKLQKHADESGNHYWGLSGPHDVPQYDESPDIGNFFKDEGGSWETPYGDFFLTWYSSILLSHGDSLLSMASAVFGNCPVTLSSKVPLTHSWYKTRSHASELTAGYYNTDKKDGYDAVAKMFARHSCRMTLTGMELSDENQPLSLRSSPQSLLSQIKSVCRRHNVHVLGENCSISGVPDTLGKIRENISGRKSNVDTFTYQRMGASLFSPDHWPKFTEFVRSIGHPELHTDDLPYEDEGHVSLRTPDKTTGNDRKMQAV